MRLLARHEGEEFELAVERHGGAYRVRIGDRWFDADLVSAGPFVQSLRLEDGTQYAIVHHSAGTSHSIMLGATPIRVDVLDPLVARRRGREDEMSGSGIVKALMPGRVTRVLVNKGDTVRKGTGLLILEAMKMENEIQAPADGVVDQLFVEAGQTVEGGADLVHIAPV